ncbi:MAG: hypothetical protein AAFR58_16625 [Cyanobacteria bacterium J06627_28]
MKNPDAAPEDTLRAEYDLRQLSVRKLGPKRKNFAGTLVRLEPDVAELFQSADAVNEALRFLAKMTRENPFSTSK